RTEVCFDRWFVLGLDDVSTKIEPAKALALLGEPTWRVLTSANNEQWLYQLETPLSGVRRARELIHAVRLKLTGESEKDPGMEGVCRYLRIPWGTNTKNRGTHRVTLAGDGARRVTLAELQALYQTLNVEFDEDLEDLGLAPRVATARNYNAEDFEK